MRQRTVRKAALAMVTVVGLASLGGCHLEVTEDGPRFKCDMNDYVFVQGEFGGYLAPVNPIVGIFCQAIAVP